MKIMIISGSNRKNSQSERISEIVKAEYKKLINILPELITLEKEDMPFWKEEGFGTYSDRWSSLSKSMEECDGFIFVVPEWHGMVPSQVKNFLLAAGTKIFWHKPALIIAISSADGGAYPPMELRGSSHKNSFILWIPEQVIIRRVKDWFPENKDEVYDRLILALNTLNVYAKEMKEVRKSLSQYSRFSFGM